MAWWLLPGRGPEVDFQPKASPNVLLISVDTLRADYLGAYGARVATPSIDHLAQKGTLFDIAVSHVPITLPSHASLFTGTYPIAHGVRDNGAFRLAEENQTLAEAFEAAGYRSAAFVGSFALDSRFGLGQGFELYNDYYGDTGGFNDFSISERVADDVLEPALAWLSELGDSSWFAFVHLYDPHAPYVAPVAFRQAYPDDAYAAEVAYADDALGRFLDALRDRHLLENTLILFTSDHGEGLGEHGEKTHGMFAYDSTLRVPLIFVWEGVLPEARRVLSRVRLIDVAPTVLELAGLDAVEGHQGKSLLPLMLEPSRGKDRESYFEALSFNLNRGWAPLTGFYQEQYKYIELPIPEVYDLEADPKELENLHEESLRQARQMATGLADLVERYSTETSRAIQTAELDEETVARLRSLGYAVTPSEQSKPTKYTPDDDPKNLTHLSDMLDAGVAAHQSRRYEEAEKIFQSILEERPTFSAAYTNLAHVLEQTGRVKEAIGVLEQAIERGVQNRTLLGRLGAYLQEAGRLEESVALLEAVVEEHPTYTEAYNYLGVSYSQMGRVDEAVATLEKVIELDPSYGSAYSNLGSVYLSSKRYAVAEERFRRALELDAGLAIAWNGLGVVYASSGRESEAISAWVRTVELDPRQYDTLYNLGTLLTKLNRFGEAIRYLEDFVENAPRDRYGDDLPKVERLVYQLKRGN